MYKHVPFSSAVRRFDDPPFTYARELGLLWFLGREQGFNCDITSTML